MVVLVTGSSDEAPATCFVCGGHGGPPTPGKIAIAAVGDSITYGELSSGGTSTYPGQLQLLLDGAAATAGKYCVVNLGEGGATMQKSPRGDSPYWRRGSFLKLTAAKWDIVVLMLGTNDAKDACGDPASFWQNNAGDIFLHLPQLRHRVVLQLAPRRPDWLGPGLQRRQLPVRHRLCGDDPGDSRPRKDPAGHLPRDPAPADGWRQPGSAE